jgi:hypothetical protein
MRFEYHSHRIFRLLSTGSIQKIYDYFIQLPHRISSEIFISNSEYSRHPAHPEELNLRRFQLSGLLYALEPIGDLSKLKPFLRTLAYMHPTEEREFVHPELWGYPRIDPNPLPSILDMVLEHKLILFSEDDAPILDTNTRNTTLETILKHLEEDPSQDFLFTALWFLCREGLVPNEHHNRLTLAIKRFDLESTFRESREETINTLAQIAKIAQRQNLTDSFEHVDSLLLKFEALYREIGNQEDIHMQMLEVAFVSAICTTNIEMNIQKLMRTLEIIGEYNTKFRHNMLPMLERFCEELPPELTPSVWQLRLLWREANPFLSA